MPNIRSVLAAVLALGAIACDAIEPGDGEATVPDISSSAAPIGVVPTRGQRPCSRLDVRLRETPSHLVLAAGQIELVFSQCAAGEVLLWGGLTLVPPEVSAGDVAVLYTTLFWDGVNPPGMRAALQNRTQETVTIDPAMTAMCSPGQIVP